VFDTILLNRSNVLTATAKGHGTDVLDEFRMLCQLVFARKGAWRIEKVEGKISDKTELDSDMTWSLRAKLK
jgi:hypothetical protein